MVPILHPLPLDWTGYSPSNIVTNEMHDVSVYADDPFKIVVLDKGYFYTHDLIVFDHLHKPLIKGPDYQCLMLEPKVASKTAFKACAVIVIKNPRIVSKVYVTARMVGGEYCQLTDAIINTANTVLAGGVRKIYWKNLKDKPGAYRPSGHMHAWWQLYGFTEPTKILMRMEAAQKITTGKDFDGVYLEWRAKFNQLDFALKDIEARLTTHINDQFDPHQVTKVQIGLSEVFNGPVASLSEAQQANGSVTYSYATPIRTKQSIEFNFLPVLQQHIDDYNNPHRVTWETLGTYSVQGLQQLANQYYTRGETVTASYNYASITWDEAKNRVRKELPILTLTSGMAPWSLYSTNVPTGATNEWVLMGDVSGYAVWKPIRTIMDVYVKKGNQVFYISGVQGYNGAGVANAFQTLIGPKPDGSIGVYTWIYGHGTNSGNGGLAVMLYGRASVVCRAGRWVFD